MSTTLNELLLSGEKTVCLRALQRVFSNDVAQAFFQNLYAGRETPFFLDGSPSQDDEKFYESEDESKLESDNNSSVDCASAMNGPWTGMPTCTWFRLCVTGLQRRYYTKEPCPPLTVKIIRLLSIDGGRMVASQNDGDETSPENGVKLPSTSPPLLSDIRIQLVVRNKWAEVTQEVLLPDFETQWVMTNENSTYTISNMVFTEISLKHGGFYTVIVRAVDRYCDITSWKSSNVVVQSNKTHSNQKRKDRSQGAQDSPAANSPAPIRPRVPGPKVRTPRKNGTPKHPLGHEMYDDEVDDDDDDDDDTAPGTADDSRGRVGRNMISSYKLQPAVLPPLAPEQLLLGLSTNSSFLTDSPTSFSAFPQKRLRQKTQEVNCTPATPHNSLPTLSALAGSGHTPPPLALRGVDPKSHLFSLKPQLQQFMPTPMSSLSIPPKMSPVSALSQPRPQLIDKQTGQSLAPPVPRSSQSRVQVTNLLN
eukprot:c2928_g1_i2.p1 GENE.c2928_g1_i2~~c2928_g1_i2.p1  ORF type:complete len:477 (+),score=85.81 c2928_g1_i2:60-1490(+)